MKRLVPLFFLFACAPAKTERAPVARPAAVTTPAPTPKVTAPGTPIVHRLASNGWQTCLARKTGSVLCWGQGALTDIDSPLPNRPTTIAGISDAVEVAIDVHWGCARTKSGAVFCFGKGLERDKGTVVPGVNASRIFAARHGICAITGDELSCFDPKLEVNRKKLPVPGAEVIDAAGERQFACLVTSKGAVYCFGDNNLPNLTGAPFDANEYSRVKELDDAITISVGDYAGCAVLANGHRACFGHRTSLGYPESGKHVVVDEKRTDTIRAAVGLTTCWLFRDGGAQCDGKGQYGQHGDGWTSDYAHDPVLGLKDAQEIAVGFDFACALRASEEVVCWGANHRAQLGDGTLVDRTLPTVVGREPPPQPKSGSGPPITPPVKNGPVVSWREPDKGGWGRRIDSSFARRDIHPTAVGVRAAIFDEGRAVHEDHGALAVEWPKGHKFLALDGDDAVWVGTKDSFLRANDVLAAKKGAFTKVLAIPYATDFAVSKGIAVAADSTTLHISRDGGKSFTKVKPAGELSIDHVFARGDGLVAIEGLDKSGEHAVWIAKDGKTFVASNFQPPRLAQVGSHLFAYGCPGGILSSDGATWNAWEGEYGAPFSFTGWGSALERSSYPRPFTSTKLANLLDPPAPAPDSKNAVKGKPGACKPGGMGGVAMGFGGRSYRRGGPCIGAACVRASIGEEPKETETEVAFYADGFCERDDKGFCKKGPWKRAPHVAVNAGAPLDVPSGCDPERILNAGGIGVLLCSSGSDTVLHTMSKEGVFRKEATFPTSFAADDVTIALDGTLVLHPLCGNRGQGTTGVCPPALVRAPKPLGATDAWRTSTPGYAYRVLGSGAVLAITPGSDGQRFSLVLDGPAKATPIAKDLAVLGDLLDVVIEKDRIVIVEQITTRKATKSYVAADGLVAIVEAKKP